MSWGKYNKNKIKNSLCVVTSEDSKRIMQKILKKDWNKINLSKVKPLPCVEDPRYHPEHFINILKNPNERSEDIITSIKKTKNENKMPIINLKAIHPKFNKK